MCAVCGKPFDKDRKTGFNDVCSNCGKDLHCCINCQFYAPRQPNECLEHIEERVGDKCKRNYCGWFSPKEYPFGRQDKIENDAAAARAKLDQLFNATGDEN